MNKEIPIPRIKGKAVELPSKRWGYELEILIGDLPEALHMSHKEGFEGWETKEIAITEMKKIAIGVMDEICKVMGVEREGFLDLTKNKFVKDI